MPKVAKIKERERERKRERGEEGCRRRPSLGTQACGGRVTCYPGRARVVDRSPSHEQEMIDERAIGYSLATVGNRVPWMVHVHTHTLSVVHHHRGRESTSMYISWNSREREREMINTKWSEPRREKRVSRYRVRHRPMNKIQEEADAWVWSEMLCRTDGATPVVAFRPCLLFPRPSWADHHLHHHVSLLVLASCEQVERARRLVQP